MSNKLAPKKLKRQINFRKSIPITIGNVKKMVKIVKTQYLGHFLKHFTISPYSSYLPISNMICYALMKVNFTRSNKN